MANQPTSTKDLRHHILDSFCQWDKLIHQNLQTEIDLHQAIIIRNAKAEQIIDCMTGLYKVLKKSYPAEALFLYLELRRRIPTVADNPIFVQEHQETIKID